MKAMTKENFEPCVCCGNDTPFKKTDNITERHFYIEGAGQLCKNMNKLEKQLTI